MPAVVAVVPTGSSQRWRLASTYHTSMALVTARPNAWSFPSSSFPSSGVSSTSYVGRLKEPMPVMGRHRSGLMPPVKMTGNGHAAPARSPSTRTVTSRNGPLASPSAGVCVYQNSSSPWNETKTSRTAR
nr:unnamed protein product [Digitaria exilis]CAB3475818.1 unnamed protein product [Digitaria exilis]